MIFHVHSRVTWDAQCCVNAPAIFLTGYHIGGCPGCRRDFCYCCGSTTNDHTCSFSGRTTWSSFCHNDGIRANLVRDPYPHDRRCGCPICPDCFPGRPCEQCDGSCVVCRGLVPPGSLELTTPKKEEEEGKRHAATNWGDPEWAAQQRAAQSDLGRAVMADSPELCAQAVARGANVNTMVYCDNGYCTTFGFPGRGGWCTAVYVAACNNRLCALRWLLAVAHADPNADRGSNEFSSSGRGTPCFRACRNHHHDAVRVLLAFGARADHSTWQDSWKCTCSGGGIRHARGCTCVQCE